MPVPRAFRLQPVLQLKERREEALQLNLAARLTADEEARAALSQVQTERERQLSRLAAQTHGRLDLTALDAATAYLARIEEQVAQGTVATAAAATASAAARDDLLVAVQERKALEQLRDQQRQALRRHLNRLEAAQADETAIGRHLRRRQEG